MITFYDALAESLNDKEQLTSLLISFDHMLELLHNNGLGIYDFDPKKIVLYDGKFFLESFKNVINDINVYQNMKSINIYQAAKIGLMAYNNQIVDGSINQEFFDFIQDNFNNFNSNGNIPEDIFEYYGELFQRLNVIYMNDYIIAKKQESSSNQNSNVIRKSLSTAVGRAYVGDENNKGYVNVLFIPSILALIYLICLVIYIFVIK